MLKVAPSDTPCGAGKPAEQRIHDAEPSAAAERNGTFHELSEADPAWRVMFDHSAVAKMLLIPFSAITHANDKFLELTGYRREEVVGRSVTELGLRVEDGRAQRFLAKMRSHTGVSDLEVNLRRKDGTVRQALISSQVVMFGQKQCHLHSLVDITGLRQAEDDALLSRRALAAITQGVLISGPDQLTLSVNKAFETMTGYAESEIKGQPCTFLQGALTDPTAVLQLRQALNNQKPFVGELLNYCKDGTAFWNELSINPVFNDTGELKHFIGIMRDVSPRKLAEQQLKLTEQVFAQSREAIVVADAQGHVVMANPAFSAITGYAMIDLPSAGLTALVSNRHDLRDFDEIRHSVSERGVWQGQIWSRNRSGRDYLAWLAISVVRDRADAICNYIGTFSDLSEQTEALERINWLSHFDSLTALPNRAMLADRCHHDISIAERDEKPLSMMVLGIDHFKLVNETRGHAAGDDVLKQLARRVTNVLRGQDTIARVSGDEFSLVLLGDGPEGAGLLAIRLMHLLAQPYATAAGEVNITVSIGIAMFPPDGLDFDTLFKSAEVALHQAKQQGRGRHCFFNAEMFQTTVAQAALASELRNAVAQDQLQLHYQPFVDLQTGQIDGMEALLRWTHPEYGNVSPAEFIPVAEQAGLIKEISHWVLRRACQDIQWWRSCGLTVPPVSVNLSPVLFREDGLVQNVESTLREFAVEPNQICMEVTESALMGNVGRSEELMRALKAMGIKLSLDDFGTGYSSLSYLKLFPFDKVKIDQSFVRDIASNSHGAVIAKVVISMAHGLGLRVIAEGVETETQCEFLRNNVCDSIQGYYFSKPVPAQDMEAILRTDRRLPLHVRQATRRLRTLLVVDDEPNVIASLRRLLRPDGYHILAACNAAEGFEQLANNQVDVVVSDQRMPGMTGIEFLHRVRSLYPETVRIVLSGYAELQSVTDAVNNGTVYRFLTKPWEDSHLRSFIDEVFRHRELAEDNQQLHLKLGSVRQDLANSNRKLKALMKGTSQEPDFNMASEAFHSIPVPILVLDDNRKLAYSNPPAKSLFGIAGLPQGSTLEVAIPDLDSLLSKLSEGQWGTLMSRGLPYQTRWQSLPESMPGNGQVVTFLARG